MNREIKFRAWFASYKQMLHNVFFAPSDQGIKDYYLIHSDELTFAGRFDKDLVLMQYTGLKEKNGKEIYEGDIVETPLGYIAEVVFGKKTLGFGVHVKVKTNYNTVDKFYRLTSRCRVLGNKYENPKLVK